MYLGELIAHDQRIHSATIQGFLYNTVQYVCILLRTIPWPVQFSEFLFRQANLTLFYFRVPSPEPEQVTWIYPPFIIAHILVIRQSIIQPPLFIMPWLSFVVATLEDLSDHNMVPGMRLTTRMPRSLSSINLASRQSTSTSARGP